MATQKSVWVVDDEPNGFEVVELLLRRERYKLTYFNNGKEVLQRLEEQLPDVILLDVMMPEMDGVETCRRIKANSNWKPIPIIMVTALDSKEDLARSLESGADDFLTKPVNGLELRSRVRSMLRIKQQYDELQATLHLRRDLSKLVVEDLQKPMSTVLLSSHLLLQSQLDLKEREQAEMVFKAGQEIDAIIGSLLRLARLEAGQFVLNRVELDLCELVEAVVANFQAIAAAKQIQVISQFPESRRWVSVDAMLFHRLLDNLMTNALQAAPTTSTVTLQVEYPDATESVKQAIVRVTDEGTGTPKELQQTILTQYEPKSLISGTASLSLGLTFSKMVAEAHGGKITIEANQPQGSIVTILV
jgi:two-component system, sensor histidine kinase and response regulator